MIDGIATCICMAVWLLDKFELTTSKDQAKKKGWG